MVSGTFSPRFRRRRRGPVILQTEAAECGLACLAMIASVHGFRTDLAGLRRRWAISQKGATLADLMQFAQSLDLAPRAVRLEPEELRCLNLPCILHWNMDHFVVLEQVRTGAAVIVDPAVGRRKVGLSQLRCNFTGVALELVPTARFSRGEDRTRLRLRDITANTGGLAHSLTVVFAVSMTLQVIALLMPFYSQLVIDDVVVSSDRDLLNLLALSFALLVCINSLVSMLRSWIVVTLSTRLNLQWTVRVFHHLARLPLDYFEKRHLGDVQSRFGSVTALQNLVTTQFVEAVIDGLMALTTLAVMVLYSTALAATVAASMMVYLLVRLSLFPRLHTASQEILVNGARKDSFFLESVRGILAIKNFGKESQRESVFQNYLADTLRATIRASRLQVLQSGCNRLVFGLQLIVVIWLGAIAIFDTRLTIGMLVAFLAYRAQFTERASALIDRCFEFRLARVQLDRLSDIVQTDPEPAFSREVVIPAPAGTCLPVATQALAYRYADNETPVFDNIDIAIAPGEHVAITGPSGCGKTTLLKVMMGLLQPSRGDVLVDGMPLARYGLLRYRQQIASVMQDDRLFAGTLIDNISFFDPEADIARVAACARIADVATVIEHMPMQYFTLVGDMGAALSGGQKQRILLARALYRRPKLLFLDESTSHLDACSEQIVNERLSHMSMTLIVVAHRRETIRHADRVVRIGASNAGTESRGGNA